MGLLKDSENIGTTGVDSAKLDYVPKMSSLSTRRLFFAYSQKKLTSSLNGLLHNWRNKRGESSSTTLGKL